MKKVASFDGQYEWLSNFAYSPFTFEGVKYPTVEHAFQALKMDSPEWFNKVREATTPGLAKRLGRTGPRRKDWQKIRVSVMLKLLQAKFSQNEDLKEKLIATAGVELQEGNTWGDTFWGVDLRNGLGDNNLGIALMLLRDVFAGRVKLPSA